MASFPQNLQVLIVSDIKSSAMCTYSKLQRRSRIRSGNIKNMKINAKKLPNDFFNGMPYNQEIMQTQKETVRQLLYSRENNGRNNGRDSVFGQSYNGTIICEVGVPTDYLQQKAIPAFRKEGQRANPLNHRQSSLQLRKYESQQNKSRQKLTSSFRSRRKLKSQLWKRTFKPSKQILKNEIVQSYLKEKKMNDNLPEKCQDNQLASLQFTFAKGQINDGINTLDSKLQAVAQANNLSGISVIRSEQNSKENSLQKPKLVSKCMQFPKSASDIIKSIIGQVYLTDSAILHAPISPHPPLLKLDSIYDEKPYNWRKRKFIRQATTVDNQLLEKIRLQSLLNSRCRENSLCKIRPLSGLPPVHRGKKQFSSLYR